MTRDAPLIRYIMLATSSMTAKGQGLTVEP